MLSVAVFCDGVYSHACRYRMVGLSRVRICHVEEELSSLSFEVEDRDMAAIAMAALRRLWS